MVSSIVSSSALSAFLLAAVTTTSPFVAVDASYELIAGYEPNSQVTDHNAIDLDQAMIEEQLALGSDGSFASAKRIYEEGAHSKSVATLTLAQPLGMTIEKGQPIVGTNADGSSQVLGKAYDDYYATATTIDVQYVTSDNQGSYVGCQVGASVRPELSGCFASSGTLTIDKDGNTSTVSYNYDPSKDNVNKRTIQGFSTSAQDKMGQCDSCPYPMYEKFYNYYGSYDYADSIVQAAFNGERTKLSNFNNDFGTYGPVGNEQIIKKATAYMNIWMYVIREMEDALDDCQEGCTIDNCNDDPVHAWDEGVAFYTGSLQGSNGKDGDGKLLYALADKRCENFKTCGDMGNDTSGTSHVNTEIFRQFSIGQSKLLKGECASAREQKETIETLMLVPLIQGALRYAYKTQTGEPYSEKSEAEGVIFAASVLPAVHACDPAAAATISSNMYAGQSNTADFVAVKDAFESTYECMGVNPAHVGGLYDAALKEYYSDAQPMDYSGGANNALVTMTTTAGLVAAITGAASVFALF